jgi:site-specific recombinase XerD
MEKIQYHLTYNRSGKLNKDGKGLIQIECRQYSKRMFISTKMYIGPHEWCAGVIINSPFACQYNAMLREKLIEIEKIEIEIWKQGQEPTLAKIKQACKSNVHPTATLADLERAFIEPTKRRSATKEAYRTTIKDIDKFDKSVTISDITYDWIERYRKYLVDKGLMRNSIIGRLRNLHFLTNEALRREIITKDPFKNIVIGEMTHRQESLTEREVLRLETIELTGKPEHVRDLFLFSCYTGLRYSDLVSLRSSDIKRINGKTWLIKETLKTGGFAKIPLYSLFRGKGLELIEKYGTIEQLANVGSNSDTNRELKQLGLICKIKTPLHWHLARHSFISILAKKGVSLPILMNIVNHTKSDTTRNYMDLKANDVGKVIDKIFTFRKI